MHAGYYEEFVKVFLHGDKMSLKNYLSQFENCKTFTFIMHDRDVPHMPLYIMGVTC